MLSRALGFAPTLVITSWITPFMSCSSAKASGGVTTGRPLMTCTTSPTLSFLDLAMREPSWSLDTTTPLSNVSSGTSKVIPSTSFALSFHRVISCGPAALLPCDKEMAESAAFRKVDIVRFTLPAATTSSSKPPSTPESVSPVLPGLPPYGLFASRRCARCKEPRRERGPGPLSPPSLMLERDRQSGKLGNETEIHVL